MLKVLHLYEYLTCLQLNEDGVAEGARINIFPGPGFRSWTV